MPQDVSHLPAIPTMVRPSGPGDTRDIVTHWHWLLDNRLIGNIPPTPPHIAAQRDTNDALFRRRAPTHARIIRECGL